MRWMSSRKSITPFLINNLFSKGRPTYNHVTTIIRSKLIFARLYQLSCTSSKINTGERNISIGPDRVEFISRLHVAIQSEAGENLQLFPMTVLQYFEIAA